MDATHRTGSLERKEWLNPQGPAGGGIKPRIDRKRPVLGPIHVGSSDGDGRGTGGVVIGTGNGRPDVPVSSAATAAASSRRPARTMSCSTAAGGC